MIRRLKNLKLSELILTRRSVRHFKKDAIPIEDLMKILEAARWAPSATNRQVIRYMLITDEELLKKISNTAKIIFYKQKHAAQAPAMIAVCGATNAWIEEFGAAIQNMLLMAWSLGIGTCWIGAFSKKKVHEILKIPDNYKIIALILFGYPEANPKPTPRLDLGKIAYLNTWKNPIIKTKGIGLLPKSGPISIVTRGLHDSQKDSPLKEKDEK